MSAFIASICSVARGSTVGRRRPSASTSSWNWRSVVAVTVRMASLRGRSGYSCRARVDLVVDVRDVAHVGDVIGAIEMAQQPKKHVEDDDRPRIADMSEIID